MTGSENGSDRQPGHPAPSQSASPEARGERRLISPFRCRIWTQHSRPDEQLTDQACRSLRESIARNGQHQPALGRPVTDDPDYDIEIICGARRHAAALALGRELLVEVRVIGDAEAYVAMYEENVERKDDCAYIQGQILRRALLSGACASQDQLARAFSLSHSKISRLLMIAQLPTAIVAAFQSPDDIRESWGVELYQRWKKDPEHVLTDRARALASKQTGRAARDVYNTLIAAPGDAKSRLHRSTPIRGNNGTVLFREQEQIASVTFTIPKAHLNQQQRDALKHAIVHILDVPTAGQRQHAPLRQIPNAELGAAAPHEPSPASVSLIGENRPRHKPSSTHRLT